MFHREPWRLPADEILRADPLRCPAPLLLGQSREGREIHGYRLGNGRRSVSLIGGCHADEPVGPATLARLTSFLASLDAGHPSLTELSWFLVPHTNPDGARRNASWAEALWDLDDGESRDWETLGPTRRHGFDLDLYLRQARREVPGDDVEFGFPRDPEDEGARPENRAVARFLAAGGPLTFHASLHGMAFAAGPWCLLERSWKERTAPLRRRLRRRYRELGYRPHDIDRGGEKGFYRLGEGFSSRPDSRAMAAHFEALGDPAMAARFRPSSMELARSLGGDPLTLVTEMPLFLLPAEHFPITGPVRPGILQELAGLAASRRREALQRRAATVGLEPFPIYDQMTLQLACLEEGLRASLEV